MQLTHWFRSFVSGLFGLSGSETDSGWRRRRVRSASTPELLEARVLLSATSHVESAAIGTPGHTLFNVESVDSESAGADQVSETDEQFCSGTCTPGGGEVSGGDVVGTDPGGGGGGAVGGVDVQGGDPGGSGQKQQKQGSGQVEIITIDDEAWEGPYRGLGYDVGEFMLTRQSAGSELTVVLEFEGDASLADFELSTSNDPHPPVNLDGSISVSFSPGAATLMVYVRTLMDSDYEPPEILTARISRLVGQGTIGATHTGQITLIDRQADLDITDMDSSELMDEDKEDIPGANLRLNSDYDAGQSQPDKDWYTSLAASGAFDAKVFEHEDDFADLTIDDHFSWPNDIGFLPNRRLHLDFNPQVARIWRISSDGDGGSVAEPIYSGDAIDPDDTFKVEALAMGDGDIALRWYSAPEPDLRNAADTLSYTMWHVDVDIDSDNNDWLELPSRTAWEDELEAHDYGIGKLVYPTPLPFDLQYDGQVFTPFQLDVATYVNDVRVRFEFPGMQGRTGAMRIWTIGSHESNPLNPAPLESGGQVIAPGSDYSVSELMAATSGDMVLWIQAEIAQTRFSDKEGVGREKPDDRVRVVVLRPDGEGGHVETVSDDIRYLIAEHRDAFYPNLQHNYGALRTWWRTGIHTGQTLRNALASEAVYGDRKTKIHDMPQYGMKLLTGDEMRALGIDADAVQAIEQSQWPHTTGLKVAIYRDFLSNQGKGYILAFGGTELDPNDIITDIIQGLGLEGDPWLQDPDQQQYTQAMEIGDAFGEAIFANDAMSDESRATGHSLGGGLASVASLASVNYLLRAETFNAAGVHPNTLYKRNSWGFRTNELRHKDIFIRFQNEAAGLGKIRAFYTRYDLLSFLQDNLPSLPIIGKVPAAIGQRISLEGPHEPVLDARLPVLQVKLSQIPSWGLGEAWISYFIRFDRWLGEILTELNPIVSRMVLHHETDYYHYGLMVERRLGSDEIEWDILGKDL